MPQLNERAAEALTSEQATAVVRLLDLQARWENHRDDPAKSAATTADLQARQKAFDAFWSARREHAAKHRTAPLPEPTQNVPDRLAVWCRTLRVVFRRAESGSPAQVMIKVYRLADRVAARAGKEVIGRGPAGDLAAGVRELDAVIAWCDGLTAPSGPSGDPLEAQKGEAA
jgi:hypothetical protein